MEKNQKIQSWSGNKRVMDLKAYVMMTGEDRSDYNGDIKKEAHEEAGGNIMGGELFDVVEAAREAFTKVSTMIEGLKNSATI